jgi:hypothetical protein
MSVFGKSWNYSFSARDGDKTVSVDSLSGARVYSSAPTDTEKADVGDTEGTSVVTEVTTWDTGTNDHEKLITFGAITDSSPYSSNRYEVYYVVVNFKYESTGDVAHSCKQVLMYRPDALTSRFGVDVSDVLTVESKLQTIKGDQWVVEKVILAEDLVEKDLIADDMDIRKVRLDDARNLVIYRAAMLAVSDLSSDSGDVWAEKYERHEAEYRRITKYARIRYDFDDSGIALPDERKSTSFAMFGRGG